MVNRWFESVAVAQRQARKVLPKSVYKALIAGLEAVTRPLSHHRNPGEHAAGTPAEQPDRARMTGPLRTMRRQRPP